MTEKPARNKPRSVPMLELLDGLSERGLLARVESVECDGVALKLAPAPLATPQKERAEKPRERDDEDEHGLKYASS